MASAGLFLRQTWTLTKKNLRIAIVRCWFSTLIRVLVIPIVVVVVLLEIPNYGGGGDPNTYGVGAPSPIISLAESMSDGMKLALVTTPGLGPDFAAVNKTIVDSIGNKDLIVHLDSEDQLQSTCNIDFHGHSNCHAVVIFNNSPLSGRANATWDYSILVDPAHAGGTFNVLSHSGNIENFIWPLQLAIENAMLNSTIKPEAFTYAYTNPNQSAKEAKGVFLDLALYILSFVFFISMCTMVHHVSSMMGKERQLGLSQLADAMSGGMSAARITSYILTFDILYLPTWIVLGPLYWHLMAPTTSPAIFIFWQILTGWGLTSATVFASAWFQNEALAGTLVTGITFLLAVLAAFQDNLAKPPIGLGEVIPLSLIFPSCNFVFFFDYAVKAEMSGQAVDLSSPLPIITNFTSIPYRSEWMFKENWVNDGTPGMLWGLLVVQIIGYLALAVLVEHLLHGNSRKHRTFHTDEAAETSHAAIEAVDLDKHYMPSIWRRIFCCARAPATKAVDGLSLVSHKRQILCLLGPNGSGKTTTLDVIAGFTPPTAGSVRINAAPSQIGVCPQKNVLWDHLTVYEHLLLWSRIKGGKQETAEELTQLLELCDLTLKRNALARNLSGGMKRKLQLACMLVGGSSLCLMDEVTSGLDPVSRRVIWNVVLQERAHRTMILTTHFLDECEVLSDHVIIMSLGKLKCQGMPAELKTQYGGGYRVHIPKGIDVSGVEYPIKDSGERHVATTPDSRSAARLLATLENEGHQDVFITGPTIEDVFLAVSKDPHVVDKDDAGSALADRAPPSVGSQSVLTGARLFWRQFFAVFTKRCIILRSQWWIYVLVLAVPIIFCSPPVIKTFLELFTATECGDRLSFNSQALETSVYGYETIVVGPQAANASVIAAAEAQWATRNPPGYPSYPFLLGHGSAVLDSKEQFLAFYQANYSDRFYSFESGGIYMDNTSAPILATHASDGAHDAMTYLGLLNQARTGTFIQAAFGQLASLADFYAGSSVIWVSIVCLIHAVWPAFFALYPTYERRSQVRALQYSNGVRALPLWLSFSLFDGLFILIISAVCTLLISSQSRFWGLGYIFLVQLLYGIAAMLMAYILSMFAKSQPAAAAWAMLVMIVEYVISSIVIIVISTGANFSQSTMDGTSFGLGVIFPIQNLLRAYMLSLNLFIIRCRDTTPVDYPGSIYAYGGPILLLIIQIMVFFTILVWLDGTIINFNRVKLLAQDDEKRALSDRPDVAAETTRVEASKDDLLRLLHVSKHFGHHKAVDDVSLGLQRGEILALLGPNGAGKTTTINMIRSEMAPTSGDIFLENISVAANPRLAQARLGVCPQFDALDKLTVREHLVFYARCKGVPDIAADVAFVTAKVGLTAHAHKLAAKLSGGNKRKLSLAIALLGNPPVLLLDEPSTAMDAASKRVFWRVLEAVAPGRSVVITTHSMEEADHLATRAAIMAGKLLAIGTTQELRKRHSNEYHGQLILKSAPLSTPEETEDVAAWVRRTCPEARLEGAPLGGQVRFVVPADAEVPIGPTSGSGARTPSFVRYLIEALEESREELGLSFYSIGVATMERVFMSVVKDSDSEGEDEDVKKGWWKW